MFHYFYLIIFLYNMESSLYKAWIGKNPTIAHFRIFGHEAHALFILEKIKKLDKIYKKCIFLGYESDHRGYKLYLQ